MSRRISALAAISIALFLTPPASAQDTWQLDPAHSAAQFSVRHLGISTVRGTFTSMSGSVQLNEADLTRSSAEVTIEATSVDTRVEKRDNDVRSPKFLDVQKFPTISFKSKRVEALGPEKFKMTGDLTIHGVTKEVVLDVDGPSQAVNDPHTGQQRRGASATTTINRQDFSVSGAPGVVGDAVTITLDIEMTKPGPK